MLKINIFRHLKSTFAKVVFLLSIVTVGLLLLVLTLYFYTLQQEKQIFKNSNELYNEEIEALLKLNSESYSSIVADITYWDEFVSFTKTKDINWFNRSVANLVETYRVEYLVAYDKEGNFLTKASTSKISTRIFIPTEVFPILNEKKSNKFYLKIPEGIVEVYGATIHPSDDPFKNKTQPSGYFFIARLLDKNYFTNIEEICSSKIKFYTGKETAGKTVFKIVPLNDFNDKKIAELYFKRAYDIDFSITKMILFVMGLALFLSGIVYYFYSVKWAKLPISLIKKILTSEDRNSISSLKNIKGEFRYIGKLFEENLEQREQLNKAKEKAEESDRLKSAFLTNLSHEIRTPMNAIVGFSDLLENHEISESDEKKYREIISTSGKNLVAIIDDLVEMSQIDTDQIQLRYSEFELEETIHYIFEEAKKRAKNKKLEFKIENLKGNLPQKVISDKAKFEQIIYHLLSNAIKFTNEGNVSLLYDVDEKLERINITVIDTGIGIESKNFDYIFKRFRKIDSDHAIRGGGIGLGLSLSKAYVEMLGGEISVQSLLGKGAMFNFYIPLILKNKLDVALTEKLGIVSIDEIEKTPSKKIETILVAEDDNFNYLLIEKILKLKNYKIIRAEDGEEAVEISLNNDNIDLILMDIKMPKMSGHKAFEEIKKMKPDMPIIAQTAYTSSEEVEEIFKTGFTNYISKPISKEKLYSLIEKVLRSKNII
ncbi:response regulator [Flavobacterium amnicola]|uniref:histidine kinase n=1 Tax=Flavobacterium amnicola TaxID=2506422 RepID=A0A4Q1K297_9FLAO|nr:response regulator [Flavobacterium amnicola]RXR18425.1 response regulator [Flavobacterium amnicola]